MKRDLKMCVAFALVFLIMPSAMACEDIGTSEKLLRTFLSWDTTDMMDNGTLSSELSSTLATSAYDNDINMGIVKLYNPDQKVGYYFAYTQMDTGDYWYIDAENDVVYTSLDAAKFRLSARGIDLENVIYSKYYPALDVIDESFDNTVPDTTIVN